MTAPSSAGSIDPDLLERLRRSGVRIDREGRFWHDGQPVTHEGLRRAFFRWLDRLPPPDGRFVLRLDEKRYVYLDVEDTPLVVRSVRREGDRLLGGLSDESEEELDPSTFWLDADGVLRAAVRTGRLPARLSTSAAAALADLMDDTAQGIILRLGSRAVPIPRR